MSLFKKKSDEEKPVNKTNEFIKNLLFAALAAFLLKTFVIETSRVPTGSMENTILVGDFLFVNKFIYGPTSPRTIPFTDVKLPYFQLPALHDPERYDIVVFEYPGDRDQIVPTRVDNYVKRCIGLPGDTIEIHNKVVYINGKEAWRPPNILYQNTVIKPAGYPVPETFPAGSGWNEDNYGPLYIPKKGDVVHLNRSNVEIYRTMINREYGNYVVTLNGDDVYIDGKKADTYTVKQDYYFMMGDNRDDSADSRFWGFVPRDKVEGEAFMIYWSWDPSISFSDFFKLLGSVRVGRIAKLVH